MSILLLEEPTSVESFLFQTLSEFGPVIRARSVVEAVAQAMTMRPDVIVTQCSVGGATAAAILAELRGSGTSAPIIMVANTDTARATVEKMRQGAFLVLAWPVTRADVIEAVRTALGAPAATGPGPETGPDDAQPAVSIPLDTTLRVAEQMFIDAVLGHNGGSVTAAARSLGVSASTLYRRQERRHD